MLDFDCWNEIKKKTHNYQRKLFCKPREIWWCKLGINIGHEQNGKGEEYERPVLVIKVFNKNICLIVPLTTSEKIHRYLFPLGRLENKNSTVIISQIKLIDNRRFTKRMHILDKHVFEKIRKNIREMI